MAIDWMARAMSDKQRTFNPFLSVVYIGVALALVSLVIELVRLLTGGAR